MPVDRVRVQRGIVPAPTNGARKVPRVRVNRHPGSGLGWITECEKRRAFGRMRKNGFQAIQLVSLPCRRRVVAVDVVAHALDPAEPDEEDSESEGRDRRRACGRRR